MNEDTFVNIDSHAHITSDELFPEVDALIKRALLKGVQAIINITTDEKTLQRGLTLQKKYPEVVFNTGATTPHDVDKLGEVDFPSFEAAAKRGELVAIGETGLDYFYSHSERGRQIEYLQKYIALAKETDLPLVFHCRGDEAFADLFAVAKTFGTIPAVLHCFTGNTMQAKKALDLGWYLSISGIVTFKKSHELREVVAGIPLDRLFVETDAPYLAPESRRGQVNEPSFIGETVIRIADLMQITPEEVAAETTKNVCRFFKLSCNISRN